MTNTSMAIPAAMPAAATGFDVRSVEVLRGAPRALDHRRHLIPRPPGSATTPSWERWKTGEGLIAYRIIGGASPRNLRAESIELPASTPRPVLAAAVLAARRRLRRDAEVSRRLSAEAFERLLASVTEPEAVATTGRDLQPQLPLD